MGVPQDISYEPGYEDDVYCGLPACLNRALCRMFATGFARPNKDAGKPSDGGKPAASLQEKGSLIQAEERATGMLPTANIHGYSYPL